MKRIPRLSPLFFVASLFFFKVQGQNEINPIITAENKIIVQVTIDKKESQGPLEHTISIVQFPKVLQDNAPIPFEVRYQNKSSEVFYLHIVHTGPTISTISMVRGATTPIPIRPDGPENSPHTTFKDQLPQETSKYSFGEGDHKITFALKSTHEITSPSLSQKQTDFSISLSSEEKIHAHDRDSISIFPNPFINKVVFDFNASSISIKDATTPFHLTIYDENGALIDQMEKKLQKDSKFEYHFNAPVKGRFYYVITSNTGQKVDSGILIKN
ncbi:hypothetical protein [Spongiimicrobium salis]|uniref:hypothetical protein n=1 Tax=Spongiimicrobium salis TaxID=1667022 RepID=UPI00374CC81A